MAELKVGLVGIGGMGGCHYGCYDSVDGAKIVAVCDVREDVAKEKTGGKVALYTDLDEMLEKEKLDMVDICTPSYLHADMAIKCLNAGLHVLCEKPMTLTAADADRVIAAAKKSGKKFMVAHVVRFMTPYVYLKEAIKGKKFGNLLRLDMKRLSSIPRWSWEDWMRDEKRSGGVGLDLSIHDLDYVLSVLGTPDSASSVFRPIEDNSTFILSTLKYGKTVVTCEGTWFNANIPFSAEYIAVFDDGYIISRGGTVVANGENVELKTNSAANEDLGINIGGDDAYADEIAYFVNCVLKGVAPDYVTPESSRASVALMEKLVK